jgi:hypothetical protein
MEALMSSPVTHIDSDRIELDAPGPTSLKTILATVVAVFAAMRAGLNSMHQYEDLRAHGVSHASAAKKACAFKP